MITYPNVTYSCQSCGGVVVADIPHHCAGTAAPADAPGDVRCGTCRWWPECDDPARWRLCRLPLALPWCVASYQRMATTATDGDGCPCWERRP